MTLDRLRCTTLSRLGLMAVCAFPVKAQTMGLAVLGTDSVAWQRVLTYVVRTLELRPLVIVGDSGYVRVRFDLTRRCPAANQSTGYGNVDSVVVPRHPQMRFWVRRVPQESCMVIVLDARLSDSAASLRTGVAASQSSCHSFFMVDRSQALESLTAEERIVLIGRLWDSLDPAAAAPLSPALAAELDAREGDADTDADAGIPWAALRDELRARIR